MSMVFNIQESNKVKGVYILKPSISEDIRGNIWTSFLKEEVEKLLPDDLYFKHDKFSESKYNVLRGFHGDNKSWKLVTCVFGEIYQVVADFREGSPTFMKWEKMVINKSNQILILIPPGIGNAYYVSSSKAVYHYKLAYKGEYFDTNNQFTRSWDNKDLNVDWPVKKPILSSRDSL
ncbi:MAG: dTDP-4-dehydrorhamnose 3,5-epimerase [Porticoccus sp.]|nr:dTDP-4-dehydrorhamnose 3,5-epimerase [Porticoccus sp.]